MYYAKQLNEKEYIGFGSYARFGNSCQFQPGSLPGFNNTSSKVNGMSVGVNYAKKLDSKWSASLGAEVNYAWLQVDKTMPNGLPGSLPGLGLPGSGKAQIEGESYALGWNAAANYAFDAKNEVGIVYRSAVNHSMDANVRANDFFQYALLNGAATGEAYGCVTLPESVMIGYGHKFNDKTRVELNGTWTRWSRFDKFAISFNGNPPDDPGYRNWKDGWRYAIGVEHKLSDKYTLLAGVAHDESAIPDYPEVGADFMVPTGTRTTFTLGTQYHDDKQTLALSIGYMKVGDLHIGPSHGAPYTHADMYDSYTKLVSISYQYNF